MSSLSGMMTAKHAALAILFIGIITCFFVFPVSAFADEDIDIKIDSAKTRADEQKSELDISEYDFFTGEQDNKYKAYHEKESRKDAEKKEELFVTEMGISQAESEPPEAIADEAGLFAGNSEYDLDKARGETQKDYTDFLVVIAFIILGTLSFFAARVYSKGKRRKV